MDQASLFSYVHDYGADLRARRVFFHHHMGTAEDDHSVGVEHIVRNLLFLDKTKSPKPIELWINNPGGWLHEMWGVIDVMNICQNKVSTIAYGNVSSAACLLLASGSPGHRYALPHASFMWHAGTTDINDSMHWADAKDRMEWERRENDRWVAEMARRTAPRYASGAVMKAKARKVHFWAEHAQGGGEKWLDAEEMLAHGIVDEVWTP